MDKKRLQEAEEQIKTALLYMNYDSSKTLTENKENVKNKKQINEIAPLVITIAAPWLWAAGAAALVGVGAWINGVWGGGDSFQKTQSFFQGCSTLEKNLKPTLDKGQHRMAADSIYNAIEGPGTDEDSIKKALSSMTTVADLCEMYKYYKVTYGDLYDDLDSDIDGEDFRKYVWAAIAPQVQDAMEDLEKIKTEQPTPISGATDNENKQVSKQSYTPCSGPNFKINCKNNKIKELQKCLGMLTKYQTGNFGPITSAKLKENGYDGNSIDTDTIDKICKKTDTGGGQSVSPQVQYGADTNTPKIVGGISGGDKGTQQIEVDINDPMI